MGKFRQIPQRKVIKVIMANGFEEVRSSKHITFKRKDSSGNVLTMWVPHHKEVSAFVLKYITKQTGKSKDEFR